MTNRPSLLPRVRVLFGLILAIGVPVALSRYQPFQEYVLTIMMLSSLSIFGAFYFFLIARALVRGGLVPYLRWSLARDLRVWLLPLPMAFVGFTLLFREELGVVYAGIIGCKLLLYISTVNLLRSIGPPQVLLLHTFDDRNYPFAAKLALATWSSVISLCPRQDPVSIVGNMEQIGTGQGSRISSDANWRRVVLWSMQVTDAIVLDLSNARAGLLEEMEFLCRDPKRFAKTVFVCQDRDAGILGYEALVRCCGREVPVDCYGHFLHEPRAKLLLNWGTVGHAIQNRIRPELSAELAGVCSIGVFVGVVVEWFGR